MWLTLYPKLETNKNLLVFSSETRMSSKPTQQILDLKTGDIVLVNDVIIGCIGYIGFVNSLSNGKRDEYIGIEVLHKSIYSNGDHGIPTSGSYNEYVYFKCQKQNGSGKQNGRFVKRMNITKKFSPMELCSYIADKQALIPKNNDPIPIPQPDPVPVLFTYFIYLFV